MKHTSVLFLISILLTSHAQAAFWGPDNYEDCVLEKMRGQDNSLLSMAKKSCEREFPYEKYLSSYQGNTEISWGPSQNRLYLKIVRNSGEYTVTKYKAAFSPELCSKIKPPKGPQLLSDVSPEYTFIGTFRFPPGSDTAYLKVDNPEQYKCFRAIEAWGKLKTY